MENCRRFVFHKNTDSFLCPFPLKSLRRKSRARIETKTMICLVKITCPCGRATGLPNSEDQHYDQLKQKTFLSSKCQPKVDFFEFLLSGFAYMFRQVVPVRRVKTLTLLQYKVGNVKAIRQGIQKRTRPNFRLTCAAKKRFCLTFLMFSTGRLRPEVQSLTLLNTLMTEKEPRSYTFHWKMELL